MANKRLNIVNVFNRGITKYEAERFMWSVIKSGVKPRAIEEFRASFGARFNRSGIDPRDLDDFMIENAEMMKPVDGKPFSDYLKKYKTLGEVLEETMQTFMTNPPNSIELPDLEGKKVLVVGNGNALETAKELLDSGFKYADDKTHKKAFGGQLADVVVLFSASGEKGIERVAKYYDKKCRVVLVTATMNSKAERNMTPGHKGNTVIVTPKITEMYTYNVSTYIGMAMALKARPMRPTAEYIDDVIKQLVEPHIKRFDGTPNDKLTFTDAGGFYIWVPDGKTSQRGIYSKKITELLNVAYGVKAQVKNEGWHGEHAVYLADCLHICLGVPDQRLQDPEATLVVPFPRDSTLIDHIAIGYYLIGKIIDGKPPYFKYTMPHQCKRIREVEHGKNVFPIVRA